MPDRLTDEEQEFRQEMSRAYKSQQHLVGGYDDWGEYTAHVAHAYRDEIHRLRRLLEQARIDPGPWEDPV